MLLPSYCVIKPIPTFDSDRVPQLTSLQTYKEHPLKAVYPYNESALLSAYNCTYPGEVVSNASMANASQPDTNSKRGKPLCFNTENALVCHVMFASCLAPAQPIVASA